MVSCLLYVKGNTMLKDDRMLFILRMYTLFNGQFLLKNARATLKRYGENYRRFEELYEPELTKKMYLGKQSRKNVVRYYLTPLCYEEIINPYFERSPDLREPSAEQLFPRSLERIPPRKRPFKGY